MGARTLMVAPRIKAPWASGQPGLVPEGFGDVTAPGFTEAQPMLISRWPCLSLFELPTSIKSQGIQKESSQQSKPRSNSHSPGGMCCNIGSMEFLGPRRRFSFLQKWPRRDSRHLFSLVSPPFSLQIPWTQPTKDCQPVVPEFSRPPAASSRKHRCEVYVRILNLSTMGFCSLSMVSTFAPHRGRRA